MQLTVLGGTGAWPAAGQACSGYLIEVLGFTLLVDPGYAILPRLQERLAPDEVDAVFISHGHPDHCADLNPLLRARALGKHPAPALPVYALPGALDPVLALDRPGMLDDAIALHPFAAGDELVAGPIGITTRSLPHFTPNAGARFHHEGVSLAYTGDCGPDPALVDLAYGADLLLAEASYIEVPADSAGLISSATDAGRAAAEAKVDRLVLTHLIPGTDPEQARRMAADRFGGDIQVARPGLSIAIGAFPTAQSST